MRLLADSVAWEVLPVNVGMIGGYINGAKYKWPHNAWQRFPNSKHVRINVDGTPNRGNCLDVESGDATAANAPHWYDSMEWCPKQDLAIYCNRGNVQGVIQAMGNRPWHLWLSTLDGTKLTVIDGKRVAACQFLGESILGVNMDLSEVYDDSWLRG